MLFELTGFNLMKTLVLVFKNIESENKNKI